MTFKDHFSKQAKSYSTFRPNYPASLFAYLASLAPGRKRAWDCGTGNGQAAIGLTAFFDEIIATDASKKQIIHAKKHRKVKYAVAHAEKTRIEANSVDLVVAGQALHWFDFEKFFAEVRRVAKPEGILAAWSYELFRICPEVDAVINRFYSETVGAYWPSERRYIEECYRTIPFPFKELPAPHFTLEAKWELKDLVGMLGTWSAVQRYKEQHGADPVAAIAADLRYTWGSRGNFRRVVWPLHLRLGRVQNG
jgi:SAM-dependent methyltransferase